MPVTKIRSRWASGLLEFFGITSGATSLKVTESGIEAPAIAGTFSGAVVGSLALTKADNYALTAAEKANLAYAITLSAGSKTVTLGLAAGQIAFVYNAGDTNAFTLKNVSGDTGTSLAAGKIAMIIASATANASKVVVLN